MSPLRLAAAILLIAFPVQAAEITLVSGARFRADVLEVTDAGLRVSGDWRKLPEEARRFAKESDPSDNDVAVTFLLPWSSISPFVQATQAQTSESKQMALMERQTKSLDQLAGSVDTYVTLTLVLIVVGAAAAIYQARQ